MMSGFGNQELGGLRASLLARHLHNATITSTMLAVKVDRSESVALHNQVAAEVRRAFAAGEASPGERLPPAKDPAAQVPMCHALPANRTCSTHVSRTVSDRSLLALW